MSLELMASDYDFSEFNLDATTDSTTHIKIGYSTDDPDKPFLSIRIENDERFRDASHYSNISLYIDSYERIDELRRYCEMVLSHIERARQQKS